MDRWGSSKVVAIPYDLEEKELMKLLSQINGAHFTGGALELIDKNGV